MRRKTAFGIMLAVLLSAIVVFNFQRRHVISGVMAETVTPTFVEENKFVYESGNAFQWLDPHVSYYPHDYWILQQTLETLLWYNGSSSTQVIPWLAESYMKINDTQYEFKLRQNIRFQDGTPFNSTAVWFSFNRLLIMDGTSGGSASSVHGSQAAWIIQQTLNTSLSWALGGAHAYNAAWVKLVLDQNFVQVMDTYTVRLNIQIPMPLQFPYLLAGPWASIISPTSVAARDYAYHSWGAWGGNFTKYFEHMAGIGDTYFNVPEQGWGIGTGPYYIESVDRSTYRVVLSANEAYWGGPPNIEHPIGTPKINAIEYLYQPNLASRLGNLTAGKVAGIAVAPLDLYAVADRNKWLGEGILESIVSNVTIYGPFAGSNTVWFNFCTNVTDSFGQLKKFQPMADWRFRMAIASAANISDLNTSVNNNMGVMAQNLIPPGTTPEGAYNPDNKPSYSYNLTKAEKLLVDAWLHPLKSMTHVMNYYNGTTIPPGMVDNSFSEASPRTIEIYVPSGATSYERVSLIIAENLNRISAKRYNPITGEQDPSGERLGLWFVVVPVPGGQQYSLASMHQIYMYLGGWVPDSNHIINWLCPVYLSTSTYFSWNRWNITSLDNLYWQAVEANRNGDVAQLLNINNEMNKNANDMVLYMWLWHPMTFFVRSTFLKGWYFNTALPGEYFASMYITDISPPTTVDDYDGLWHTTDFTITLTATDPSGVADTFYNVNDGPTKKVSINGQPFINVEGTNNKLEYWSTDTLGNEESHHTLINIKLDKSSPTISIITPINNSEIRTSQVAATWNGLDNISGLNHYEVRLDSDSWINVGTEEAYTFAGASDGTHTLILKAVDNASNSKTASINFTVNTSLIGGPGYFEELAVVAIVVVAVIGTATYLIRIKKK